MCKKLNKNSQPFVKKMKKCPVPSGGIFLTHTVQLNQELTSLLSVVWFPLSKLGLASVSILKNSFFSFGLFLRNEQNSSFLSGFVKKN